MPSLYEQELINRAKSPVFFGCQSQDDTHTAEGKNLSCGDEITIWAKIGGDEKILSLKHETRGCAVCTASADLLCEKWQGKALGDLIGGLDFAHHIASLGISLSPLRQKCATLPCETLQNLHPLPIESK